MPKAQDSETNKLDVDPAVVPVDLFEPIALLGQGALGYVYLCIDKRLGKQVAVKCLSSITDDRVVSFHNEARIASRLNHASVIRILDFGIAGGGRPYMVLEYFEGRSLQEILSQSLTLSGKPSGLKNLLTEAEALELFLVVCEALKYLHENGVFHRDLKPSNILVRKNDDGKVEIRLIDFNLSKTTQDVQSRTFIQGKTVVGTPFYMSPDQVAGMAYDARSEIYSLGCVMYEVLTGVPVFDGETPLEILNKHANAPIVSPLEFNPELSHKTITIVKRCLNKEKEARFQSIDQLIEELQLTVNLSERQIVFNRDVDKHNRLPVAPKQIFREGLLLVDKRKLRRPAPILLVLGLLLAVLAFAPAITIMFKGTAANKRLQAKETLPTIVSRNNQELVTEFTDGLSVARRNVERGDDDITIPFSATDDDLKFFADKHEVKRLCVTDSIVTDQGLDALSGMRSLQYLGLDRTDVKTLAAIPHLKTLTALSLRGTRINDDSLKNLEGLKLYVLKIPDTAISDQGLASLIGLPLVELNIGDTQITDRSVGTILTFKLLTFLYAEHTKLTINGIRKIAGRSDCLRRFDLRRTLSFEELESLAIEFPTVEFIPDQLSIYDKALMEADNLAKRNRLIEAAKKFEECDNIIKKRYGDHRQLNPEYPSIRKRFLMQVEKQKASDRHSPTTTK